MSSPSDRFDDLARDWIYRQWTISEQHANDLAELLRKVHEEAKAESLAEVARLLERVRLLEEVVGDMWHCSDCGGSGHGYHSCPGRPGEAE